MYRALIAILGILLVLSACAGDPEVMSVSLLKVDQGARGAWIEMWVARMDSGHPWPSPVGRTSSVQIGFPADL